MSFARKSVAYLKVANEGEHDALTLSADDSPILRPLGDDLLAAYLVDEGDAYSYVQGRHLEEEGLDRDALHGIALENLSALVNTRGTTIRSYGQIFAVLMGGDFEASLIMLEVLWEQHFRDYVNGDFAVAIPARDILAFCDASDAVGLDELRQLIARVWPNGDHLLSNRLYFRRGGAWMREPLM
jgi:uncharacterized protein YtpQ (UPF0354 family)